MNFRTIDDMSRCIAANLHRVPRDVDVIVGIPRSGLLAANILALHLNKPLTDVEGLVAGRLLGGGRRTENQAAMDLSEPRRVLVIDDSVLSGTQLERTRQRIEAAGLRHSVRYAAVYATANSAHRVDLHLELCELPRMFQWNFMHHPRLDSACVDIDGVLCRDPLDHENDDGANYERFLRTADPLHLPTARVRWLVTCRLEKYRRQTERWLAAHGVRYDELVMWDLPSKAARVAAGSHGSFKGRFYRDCGATLFIESSRRQAREIADVSGKPVLCVEGLRVVEPSLPIAAGGAVRALRRKLTGRVHRKLDSLRHRLVSFAHR